LEPVKAAAKRAVPDVVSATDAEATEEGGVFFVRGAGGGAVALFKVGEDAGAAVGERRGAFDPDGAFFQGQLDQPMKIGKDPDVVTGLSVDEKLDDLAETALVDRAVGLPAGAEALLGALA